MNCGWTGCLSYIPVLLPLCWRGVAMWHGAGPEAAAEACWVGFLKSFTFLVKR